MSLDISNTIEPDSSQINSDDLISGPVTVTVREVSKGTAEQPVNIHLQEYPDRAYRPSKSMRRVIVAAWGPDASQYAGRQLQLFRNPDIRFGREVVGGIEIAAMSHLDKPLEVPLTVSRGKRRKFVVQPLQQQADTDWQALITEAGNDRDALLQLHGQATQQNAPQDVIQAIITAGQQATQPEQEQGEPEPEGGAE